MEENSKQRKACLCVDLEEGVLMEILVRLPVKSLINFRLVSKSWLLLISSYYFRHLHTLCRRPPSLLLSYRQGDANHKLNFFHSNSILNGRQKLKIIPFDINVSGNFKILSCSNGLMLLYISPYNDYTVYNPTTKQSKKLSLPYNKEFLHVLLLHLLFDPCKSSHYKIVCILMEIGPPIRHQIEVFSSDSGTWRVCVEPFTTSRIVTFTGCLQCKSLIYCCSVGRIYCFDIVKNVSEFIACPIPKLAEAAYAHSVQESNGSLYYCAILNDGLHESAALWKLQVNVDDPCLSKWALMYKLRVHLPGWVGSNKLTFIMESSTMLVCFPRKIIAYNFIRKTYKELLDFDLELENNMSDVNILRFDETLALL